MYLNSFLTLLYYLSVFTLILLLAHPPMIYITEETQTHKILFTNGYGMPTADTHICRDSMLQALWGKRRKRAQTGSPPPRGRRESVQPWEQPEDYTTRIAATRERRSSLFGAFMKLPRKRTDAAVFPTAWENQRADMELGHPQQLTNPQGHFAAREAAQQKLEKVDAKLLAP